VPVLVRDGRPCLAGSPNYSHTGYTPTAPYSYSSYPAAYGYGGTNSVYPNTYSCATYSNLAALPATCTATTATTSTTAANAFMNVNLGNLGPVVTPAGPGVTPTGPGNMQGIRAW